MARTATTKSREALAAEVAEETPKRSAQSIAEELAPYLRDVNALFGASRVAYAGIVEGGQTAQAIAEASTVALATLMYPDTKSAAHKFALTESVTKGGAKVTRVAIDQRKNAWADIIAAGIDTPTPELVERSYKLATTGGSAEPRRKVVLAVSKLPAAKRADAFAKKSAEALTALRSGNKERTAERAATKAIEGKADSPKFTPDTASDVDVALAFLQAIATVDWSDTDRARIMDAIADTSARLQDSEEVDAAA